MSAKLKQRDIRGFRASYHRNGVVGSGFWACSFYFLEAPHQTWLTAIVFDAAGHVAVHSGNLAQKWRGDDFEPLLRKAIALVEKNSAP